MGHVSMIIQGDCLRILKLLESESVQTCVTSPPYWGLRDYGVDGQIGQEQSPEAFIGVMVDVFREVRRVLRDDGTLWLNLGDSYARQGGQGPQSGSHFEGRTRGSENICRSIRKIPDGLKNKDLVGMPWRVALALQADGWYLRQEIIWHKPNPMPESVTDRCTKAHEHLFLLSKSDTYFFDHERIKEPVTGNAYRRGKGNNPKAQKVPSGWDTGPGSHNGVAGRYRPKQNSSFSTAVTELVEMRNKRSVWTVATKPFPEAHFATYPPDLIEPCILAGSNPGDKVLDPFFGAGTTGLVAENHGRRYVGIELNLEYVQIAQKRLKPTLICEMGNQKETA